ncbi:MAG: hypothetical protein PHV17_08335 [Candidatus Omnitrophica bacterium]|nr:hypothetical protein [Candidatus Omnitrophota bacterium]
MNNFRVYNKIFVLSFITVVASHSYLFAEKLILNSGKIIEGEIVGTSSDSVKLKSNGIVLTYYNDQIKTIDGKPFPQPGSAKISFLPNQPNSKSNAGSAQIVYSKKNNSDLNDGEQIIFDNSKQTILYTNISYMFMITLPSEWSGFYKKMSDGQKLYSGDNGDAISFRRKEDGSVSIDLIMERGYSNLDQAVNKYLDLIKSNPQSKLLSGPETVIVGREAFERIIFFDDSKGLSTRYFLYHPKERTTYVITFNCLDESLSARYNSEFNKILESVIPGIGLQITL